MYCYRIIVHPGGKTYSGGAQNQTLMCFVNREYFLFMQIRMHNASINGFNVVKAKLKERDMNNCKNINIFRKVDRRKKLLKKKEELKFKRWSET